MVLSIHCPPPESIPKTREVRGICGIVGFLSTNSFTYDVKLGILTVLRVLRGIVGSVMSWRWVWLEASVSVIFPRFQKRMQMIRLDCRRPRLISLPHTAPCQRAQRGINVLYICYLYMVHHCQQRPFNVRGALCEQPGVQTRVRTNTLPVGMRKI